MSAMRRCMDCPDATHTACCFAFGRLWRHKSRNGLGCAHPMDDAAERWRRAGWTPGGRPRPPPPLAAEDY